MSFAWLNWRLGPGGWLLAETPRATLNPFAVVDAAVMIKVLAIRVGARPASAGLQPEDFVLLALGLSECHTGTQSENGQTDQQ